MGTEPLARNGEGVSPVEGVKAAVAGFASDFRGFRAEIEKKLQQQDERMNKLDQKTMMAARPVLERTDYDAPHKKAMAAYLRTGDDDGLRGLELEEKALSSVINSDGGYLVDPVTSQEINSVLASTASIRAIANVVHVEAISYDVLIDSTEAGAGWADETSA